jgi:predicted amidophosphoribosyltransferase
MADCGICLTEKSSFHDLSCCMNKNLMCTDCVAQLRHNSCPYCREPFDDGFDTASATTGEIMEPSIVQPWNRRGGNRAETVVNRDATTTGTDAGSMRLHIHHRALRFLQRRVRRQHRNKRDRIEIQQFIRREIRNYYIETY